MIGDAVIKHASEPILEAELSIVDRPLENGPRRRKLAVTNGLGLKVLREKVGFSRNKVVRANPTCIIVAEKRR